MASYPFSEIEPRWQQYWEENGTNTVPDDFSKPKYYVLDMFPYPSGAGLHIGHPEGYTATDIIARYKRMKGYNVLHPMGFDAFGLPTERYSMVTGIHPAQATAHNVQNFKRQLSMLGLGYDWQREINTTQPSYYKWTQWMFLKIYNSWYDPQQNRARHIDELIIPREIQDPAAREEYRDAHRLAYTAMIPVNWCEALGTVLANEEVDEWKEKGYTVERRPMRQWMIRITAYAQRLLDDLELVEWPASTKEMQKHWIGRSEGAEISFALENNASAITVFTTRPDTVFGATYLVLAPEHPAVEQILKDEYRAVIEEYRQATALKSDLERTELNKEKTGVFTGGYAINPANGQKIPVWIADYVLAHYGTGAIMAVPGHDERDHEFALAFDLPIIQVVKPADGSEWDVQQKAFTAAGINMNSQGQISLDGLSTGQAKQAMIQWLESNQIGRGRVQFRLRDWLFSRQRYWGEPIPVMYFEDGTRRALDEDELPLVLPDVKEYKPAGTGESPLATVESWIQYKDPKTGRMARLETNTMPQWAGSCWYYLRYADPHNQQSFCSTEKEQYWMGNNPDKGGVDLYVGGAEHAVLHLLYARFWHKVLFDFGFVSTREPFARLFHQGLILGEDGRKMSKSLGNVVNPDDIVRQYGADSLRLFEMFMGPLEAAKPWSSKGVEGVNRFLNRVWRLIVQEDGSISTAIDDSGQQIAPALAFALHSTIKKVGEDIEALSFNTAIAQMMICVNEFTAAALRPRQALNAFIRILAPFAPHIAEELWRKLGNQGSVHHADWPAYDPAALVQSDVEIVVQVNSKIRSRITVPVDAGEDMLEKAALADEQVQKHIEGKTIRKKIIVPGKLVNLIVG
jgi:leucyl-tRNA synthetase